MNTLTIADLGVVCEMLGRTMLNEGTEGIEDGTLTLAAIEAGFLPMAGGPKVIASVLLDILRRPSPTQSSRGGIYAPLYDWLLRGSGADPAFDALRDVVAHHVLSTWALDAGTEVFSCRLETRRFHSVTSAAQAYGLRPGKVAIHLSDAGIEGRVDLPPNRRIYPADPFNIMLERISGSVSFPEASDRLGLPRNEMMALIEAGLMKPPLGGSGSRPRFGAANIELFVSRHEASPVETGHQSGPESYMTISEVARRLNIARTKIYARILDGTLTSTIRTLRDRRWSSLAIRKEEADSHFGDAHLRADTVAITTAAKTLVISAKFLRALGERGYANLETELDPRTNQPKTTMPKEQLKDLAESFMSIREAARRARTTVTIFKKWIGIAGVEQIEWFDNLWEGLLHYSDAIWVIGERGRRRG